MRCSICPNILTDEEMIISEDLCDKCYSTIYSEDIYLTSFVKEDYEDKDE